MAESIEFKSSQLTLTLVRVLSTDMDGIEQALAEKMAKGGRFLIGAPVVVDPVCEMNSVHLAQITELLRQQQLTPVGIRTAEPSLVDYAQLCGLAVFKPASAATSAPVATPPVPVVTEAPTVAPTVAPTNAPEAAQPSAPLSESASLVKAIRLTGLRSGQAEKHLLHDVTVSGSINSGAELYVGGNLTVLGACRGRVHAGATGDRSARILARDFNPELVSIAGVFLLADDIPDAAKKGLVEVYLDDQSIKFSILG